MKIAFMTMEKHHNRENDSIGSSRIRARWLWEEWEGAEEHKVGGQYDVVIYQKVYWRDHMELFDGIKILDLCDPDWLDGAPVIEHCNLVDAITCSSKNLADYVQKLCPDKIVKHIPDRMKIEDHKVKEEYSDTLKKVVWFGYAHNQKYLVKTLDWLTKYGLSLHIISNEPYNIPFGFKVPVTFTKYSYPEVNFELTKYDAALLPSVEEDDYRGYFKSNNKAVSCYFLKLPVISHPDDIKRLMSKDERVKEAEEKYNLAMNEYTIQRSVQDYKDLIDEIKQRKSAKKTT